MRFCGKSLLSALLLLGALAGGSAAGAEPFQTQTVVEYFPPRNAYQNTPRSELPPVQSYNPNTGETVRLEPAPAQAQTR